MARRSALPLAERLGHGMPQLKLSYYETAPGEFGMSPDKAGCPEGDCGFCYNRFRLSWNNLKVLFDITADVSSVAINPYSHRTEAHRKRVESIKYSLLTNDFGCAQLRGDACSASSVLGLSCLEQGSEFCRVFAVSSRAISAWKPKKRREILKRIFEFPNTRLLLGAPGNRRMEAIQPEDHVETAEIVHDLGFIGRLLVTCHPLVVGESDWSHLPRLRKLGLTEYSVRGFWYEPWMDEENPGVDFSAYHGQPTGYLIPPTFDVDQRLADVGMVNISVGDWLTKTARPLPRKGNLDESEQRELITELFEHSQILGFEEYKGEYFDRVLARRMLEYVPEAAA